MRETDYEERVKALEEEISVMKERYRILAETTPALLFEYIPSEDRMIFFYNFPGNNKKREIPDYRQFAVENPLVHPDHLKMFMNALLLASKAPIRGEIEYLSKITTEDFEWHRTYYSSIADEEGKVLSVLGRIQNIHESVTEKQKLQHRVETDFLTGLYNKGAATDKINRWLQHNPTGEAHVVMIDIDNFKVINDRYGHALGDEVLKEVARLMTLCFRESSIMSRFGGDEFIIFITDETINFVESRVDRFMNKLSEEVTVLEQAVSCSVGIAVRASRQDEFEDLFNRADNAMYMAKKAGKNCYYIHKE